MAEGAGFSGRYANKPLPDVSGVRFGLKLLLVSAGIIVVGESLPAARQPVTPPCLDAEKRFRLLSTNFTASNARARALYRWIRRPGDSTRQEENDRHAFPLRDSSAGLDARLPRGSRTELAKRARDTWEQDDRN